ncbi:MAG: 16S rRNA (guanine(527)-N(7))-methyltransferase RsmG [Alphaproteobacteria bacterium]|nr:16S rRNA (guanine(527)-N(7))-methyltransferase RsmG [Alphaproteobacteria bacterium]
MENFDDKYNVSRETFLKLKLYHQSLIEWQNKFNLVSPSSLNQAWNRHFEDSMQLFSLIPPTSKTLLDMGSGAGFPGMVLAIMANEKTPYLKVSLVDSVTKKTLYLKHVKEITQTDAEIINARVESLFKRKFDVITARAVTALNDLLGYAHPLLNSYGTCIFPKGRSWCEEVEKARKEWNFSLNPLSSTTSEEGKILVITELAKKGRK